MTGFHVFDVLPLLIFVVPWVIAFAWMMPDANRRGQPGIIWALVTLPLGWLAILAYLVTRSLGDTLRHG